MEMTALLLLLLEGVCQEAQDVLVAHLQEDVELLLLFRSPAVHDMQA